MATRAEIIVRYTAPGWHFWPHPPDHRAYLAYRHRHLFYVEVVIQVFDDDREIEFHDVLDFARSKFDGGDLGSLSCEHMARGLLTMLQYQYGEKRRMSVTIYEDNEVGGRVSYLPEVEEKSDV